MKFYFTPLYIPNLSESKLIKLAEFTSQLNDPSAYPELDNLGEISATPPRPLDEIFSDIQNGQADRVSFLEWAFCLYNKIDWDRDNPTQSRQTSEAIWEQATRNSWLKNFLFWRLTLYLSNPKYDNLAPSLADCFPNFAPRFTDSDTLKVKILIALGKPQSDRELAKLSWQNFLTPEELLKTAQLPPVIPTANAALDAIVELFCTEKKPDIEYQELLIKCLKQMSSEQQIRAVENLVSKILPTKISSILSKLVKWLRQNYGLHTVNSQWHQLSQSAKSGVQKWIKAASYQDFQMLVNDVLLRHLNFDKSQYKQLKGRTYFCLKNYREHFERFRILLPQESADRLGSDLPRDVDILATDDDSKPTEICIFDFGDCFVVDFFRGIDMEIHLFNRHQPPNIEQKLFGSSTLSIKQIRSLGGEIHKSRYLAKSLRKMAQRKI